jgi:transcriptional regulator with XRE-family HTH domain
MIKHQDTFRARLKQARQEAQLKQEQVARYLRIPVSGVSAFETGARNVTAVELYMLSRLYKKPMDWFFNEPGGKGAANSNSVPEQQKNTRNTIIFEDVHDPILLECFHLMKKADVRLQRSAAYGIIGFLSDR